MNKRNDSVTCASRSAKIFRASYLTNGSASALINELPGLACRQFQTFEWVGAGISSTPSI